MKRWLFSLLCLILFAATITLWIRSYRGSDYLSRNKVVKVEPGAITSHRYAITFTRGSIRLGSELHTYYPHAATVYDKSKPAYWGYGRLGVGHLDWDAAPTSSLWNKLGFSSYETGFASSFSDSNEKIVAFPAALPVILFAIPPLLTFRVIRKRRLRRRANLCAHCGYDLRATPGKCPECGQTTAASHSAQIPSGQSDSPAKDRAC